MCYHERFFLDKSHPSLQDDLELLDDFLASKKSRLASRLTFSVPAIVLLILVN